MNLLLDTHTLIWLLEGDRQLSQTAKSNILNPDNTNFVSVASFWEIAIKISIEKLEMKKLAFKDLGKLVWENGIEVLPIQFADSLIVSNLPFHHKDPFDRMLAAQALSEQMAIVTKDPWFPQYGVPVIW